MRRQKGRRHEMGTRAMRQDMGSETGMRTMRGAFLSGVLRVGVVVGVAALATAVHADEIAEGRQKAEEICAACHGKDGNTPIDPTYPRIAGQHRDYLEHSLLDYRADRRKNLIMGPQAKMLSRQDIRNLAAYYASLPGTLENKR